MLIAIEGIDGSGKGTQSEILFNKLKSFGHKVSLFRFPQYQENFFGNEIGKYLNGDFGDLTTIPSKFSALLYALDRYQTAGKIRECLSNDSIVICDRYTPSNIAHQSTRPSDIGKYEMQDWIKTVEYDILNIPKPDIVILLDTAVLKSQELVSLKNKRAYTDMTHDIHEMSADHLSNALENFREIAKNENWKIINCLDENNNMRSIDEISLLIFKAVSEALYG